MIQMPLCWSGRSVRVSTVAAGMWAAGPAARPAAAPAPGPGVSAAGQTWTGPACRINTVTRSGDHKVTTPESQR